MTCSLLSSNDWHKNEPNTRNDVNRKEKNWILNLDMSDLEYRRHGRERRDEVGCSTSYRRYVVTANNDDVDDAMLSSGRERLEFLTFSILLFCLRLL